MFLYFLQPCSSLLYVHFCRKSLIAIFCTYPYTGVLLLKVTVPVLPDDTDIGRWERLSGNFAGLIPRSFSTASLSSSINEREAKKREGQRDNYMLLIILFFLLMCIIVILFCEIKMSFCNFIISCTSVALLLFCEIKCDSIMCTCM